MDDRYKTKIRIFWHLKLGEEIWFFCGVSSILRDDKIAVSFHEYVPFIFHVLYLLGLFNEVLLHLFQCIGLIQT